jgi:hypothetical protein
LWGESVESACLEWGGRDDVSRFRKTSPLVSFLVGWFGSIATSALKMETVYFSGTLATPSSLIVDQKRMACKTQASDR